ncbi:fanconi-associated nuclease 1-like [Panulirus ornatus]|uniref:fanconi-associated nuclease 1-like n=1 Tax=Panulirus ornatus TaxID=150431 RepID=UPI003A873AFA
MEELKVRVGLDAPIILISIFEVYLEILEDVQECMDGKRWDIALQRCELAKTAYQDLVRNKELMDHHKSLPRFLRRFTSVSLLVYILMRSVECYQRTKRYQKAVDQLQELLDQKTYLMDYHGCWYERLALNLEVHMKKPKLALEVIGKSLNDPLVREGHRLSLSMRAKRMTATARCKNLAPMIAKMPLMSPKEAPRVMIEGCTIRAHNWQTPVLFLSLLYLTLDRSQEEGKLQHSVSKDSEAPELLEKIS